MLSMDLALVLLLTIQEKNNWKAIDVDVVYNKRIEFADTFTGTC